MRLTSGLIGLVLISMMADDGVWARKYSKDDTVYAAWKLNGETTSTRTTDESQEVYIDHGYISEKLLQVKDKTAGGVVNLHLDLSESTSFDCNFREMSVMSPDLAARYHTTFAASGHCSDGSTAIFSIDTSRVGSFRGYFVRDSDRAQYSVDPDNDSPDPSSFVLSRVKNILATDESWPDTIIDAQDDVPSDDSTNNNERKLESSGSNAYMFRIAIMTR